MNIIIGACEIIGIIFGDRMSKLMPDHKAFYITMTIFLLTTSAMLIFDLDPKINYALILIQILS